ncbi:iron-containing alcohol dehydrogenase [Candidatus Omnitrophota bacterium]
MENKKIEFLLESNMKYGIGQFEKLPVYLKEMNFVNLLIIIDNALIKFKYIENIISECKKIFKKCEVLIYELGREPTYDYLDECSEKACKHNDIDVIVGIGGGSTIDMAKGVAVLMTNKGSGIEYRGFPKGINRPLPVIAIPTTAGTGSDATYNAVFTDSKAEKKLGINTTMNFPKLSILDPKLVSSCPKGVIASSGMDALTHAMESFVSKKATVISRMLSIEAARLILPNLERVFDFSEDLDVKGELQLGAYLAGIALFNASSGPAGALSYLLGAWYNVPHGIAGAVFLPHIHRFNFESGYHDYSIIYDAIHGNDNKKNNEEKAGLIINRISLLNKKLGIKEKLSLYGVKKEELGRFEQEASTTLKAAFDLNPIDINRDNIARILNGLI